MSNGEGNVVYHQSKKHKRCCHQHLVQILVSSGLILIIAGVVCAITEVFEDWAKDEIREGVKLKEGNEVYDKWLHPENPRYLTFYMFNVTNAQEVSNGGIPNLQQLGPYTYRMFYNTTILSRDRYSSGSLTYLSDEHLVYVKKLSCKNCDPAYDAVTNVNLPFLTTIEMITKLIKKKYPNSLSFAMTVMDKIFVKLDLPDFHTRTVHELLWGYKDPALSKAHDILLRLAKTRDPTFDMKFPRWFALQRNRSTTLYTLDSGEHDVDNVGQYLRWNNRPNITCWSDKYANMINGTGGTHFQPFLSKDDSIYTLVTQIYRSVRLIYDSTVQYRGIRLYRFAIDPDQLESGDINGNNKGFCRVEEKKQKCLTSGLFDLSFCDPSGAPLVLSLPHFYMANKTLLNTVNGLNPKKYEHGTFLDIEPHVGITMRGNKRIQINVPLRNIKGISAFRNTTTVYLPMFFANEHGHISEEDADDFKHDVLLPLRLSKAAPFVLFGLGAIFLLIAGVIAYRRHYRMNATSDERISLVLKNN